MPDNLIKSTDLAKELGVKASDVVKAVSRLRGVEYHKGARSADLTSAEVEELRRHFATDLFLFPHLVPSELPPAVESAAFSVEPHLLQVNGLTKIYGKRHVVNGVNLSVSTGDIVGLLGPNGAGKTTTFYMVVGLIKPDGGEILLDSKNIRNMPMYVRARNGIGYLPQEPSIFRKLTVRQNLEAVLEIAEFEGAPRGKAEINAEVDRLLREFNLLAFADREGFRLSGGERRRTEIARAIAVRPTFMLFDEPFAGIDPIAIIELKKMLSYLKSKGLGILITDHNVRETLSITDRAYIISNGSVLAEGAPEDIVENREVREAYLGEDFRLD